MTAILEPFHAISVSVLAHRLKAEGRSVIHMAFGQPSTGAPAAAIAEAHRVLDADPMGYWQSDALKARIADHYAQGCGAIIQPTQVILTNGASPALLDAVSDLQQQVGPVGYRGGTPTCSRCMRRIKGLLNIRRRGTGHLTVHLAGYRSHIFEVTAVSGRYPFAADEIVIARFEGNYRSFLAGLCIRHFIFLM